MRYYPERDIHIRGKDLKKLSGIVGEQVVKNTNSTYWKRK